MSTKQVLNANQCDGCDVRSMEYKESTKTIIVKSVLKQLRAGTPFYSIHLPINMVEPKSLLEKLSDFFIASPMIDKMNEIPNPEDRFIKAIGFYLSSWHTITPHVRTPYNPILGEVYRCSFEHLDSSTEFIAEQISHHPPSTAYCVFNKQKRFYLRSYLRPQTKFCGNSIEVLANGTITGYLLKFNEIYEMTYPKFVTKGVIIGNLKLEVGGKTVVRCDKTGFLAEIEFKSKSQVHGKIYKSGPDTRHLVYTLEGEWDDKVILTNCATKEETVLLDVKQLLKCTKVFPPEEEQLPTETLKVWNQVSESIRKNDLNKALETKIEIEERQRKLARESKSDWTPRFFHKQGEDWHYKETPYLFGKIEVFEPQSPS